MLLTCRFICLYLHQSD